ncbi:DUF2125 domain-containing protein [Methylobrevis pamukkalensis]|uniref:Uncharacterized protein n=1 Tax=Methylobrevis pamukkalensis TaxID=1439726 RepID=A0A1E3H8J9_9HYPH|nr:DUF2125 domain-containing protein [Methylobrevis pamukkalensis]ODN72650.1 hypothetical protein A6302_00143 [Methylobrevis pamukkalensis]
MQASLRHDGRTLERVSVAADSLSLDVAAPGSPLTELDAVHGEFHARPDPDGRALDVATSLRGATLLVAGIGLLPNAADLAASAKVLEAGRLVPPRPERIADWQGAGGRILLDSFALGIGETRFSGSGTLALDAEGVRRASLRWAPAALPASAS